jgi:hypothetical protein
VPVFFGLEQAKLEGNHMRRRLFVSTIVAALTALVLPTQGVAAAAEDKTPRSLTEGNTMRSSSDAERLSTAAVDENALYALSPNRDSVWMYDGLNWAQIGGPAAQIYAGGGAVVATSQTTGDLFAYEHATGIWHHIGGPGTHFVLDDYGYLWGLSGAGVFEYQGGTTWAQIGGPAATLRAGSLWGLLATSPQTGEVFAYDGGGVWFKIGGPGRDFAVTTEGFVYGLNDGGIFAWLGGTDWYQVGGPAANMYSGGFLVATTPNTGDAFRFFADSDTWAHVGGPGSGFATTNGGTLYGTNAGGLFRWSGSGTSWSQVGGPAATIAT